MPGLPGWVVPARSEVSDLEWVAYRLWRFEGMGALPAGVHATAEWVAGGGLGLGPVTGIVGQPVTEDLAKAELAAAVRVYDMAGQAVGREYLAQWAYGVWRTLSWLVGVAGSRSPYPIPVRHPEPDWRTLSAQELYDRAIAADPQRYEGPAQRWELRQQCERDAWRSANLAVLIETTLRRAAAAADA